MQGRIAKRGRSGRALRASSARARRASSRFRASAAVHLLDLPDTIIHTIFDKISCAPGAVGGHTGPALNFALTCSHLYNYYRRIYAVSLVLMCRNDLSCDDLFFMLNRLPSVRNIFFDRCTWKVGPTSVSGTLGAGRRLMSVRDRAAKITGLNLSSLDALTGIAVHRIVRTYRNLVNLSLSNCDGVDDRAVTSIANGLADSLQSLKLHGSAEVSDAAGVLLAGMTKLVRLGLSGCVGLSDVTFSGLGSLRNLKEFDLSQTSISDAAARDIFPLLTRLECLKLERCGLITCEILAVLPRSIKRLSLSHSGALDGELPLAAFQGMTHLTSLDLSDNPYGAISNLEFLAPLAPHLQELHFSGSGVSDKHAAHWVKQMPELRHLDLSSSKVGDETASSISSLSKIRHIDMSGTLLSNFGVRALSALFCRAVKCGDVSLCPDIVIDHRLFEVPIPHDED